MKFHQITLITVNSLQAKSIGITAMMAHFIANYRYRCNILHLRQFEELWQNIAELFMRQVILQMK